MLGARSRKGEDTLGQSDRLSGSETTTTTTRRTSTRRGDSTRSGWHLDQRKRKSERESGQLLTEWPEVKRKQRTEERDRERDKERDRASGSQDERERR